VEAGTTKGNVEGEETGRRYTRPYLLVSMSAPVDQEGGVAKGVQTINQAVVAMGGDQAWIARANYQLSAK
jgi:hypothetical protein